ncbi:MAG: bifunctional glutamate N-acetyltransferase/amino-acid acetyltransferase ArgJ [Candidatus Omnitrophota bacterium]
MITKPKGFLAAGISCGIKKSGKKDLALIFSKTSALAYGVFTANKVKAVPLLISAQHLRKGRARAVIINSGNANCYTGKQGLKDAKKIISLAARKLGIKTTEVLAASTGIIGKQLPMKKILPAIKPVCSKLSKSGGVDAAKAIQTTDKFLKQAAKSFKIGKKTVSIGAMAKGAGMIFPNLTPLGKNATMLCFITSDALIEFSALKKALDLSVEQSFDAITVDGCMSTNDMVLILANGEAKNKKIKLSSREFNMFRTALSNICQDLAKKIILDAEGATKFIKINIKGAKSIALAKKCAFSIANSPLFKTACFGENRNIGRVISAIGAVGVSLDENKTKINLSSLKKKNIFLNVDLKQGKSNTTVYTCDLSPEYIKINAGYS